MDREKVIKGWERCQKCEMSPLGSEEGTNAYLNCEYTVGLYCNRDKLIAETLALLKEQQNQIWEMQDRTEYLEDKLKEQPQIVLCKDCKHWSAERINDYNKCKRWINVGVKNFATMGDWFCADGERKEVK